MCSAVFFLFSFYIQSGTFVHGWVLLTFMMSLPSWVNSFWKYPHRHTRIENYYLSTWQESKSRVTPGEWFGKLISKTTSSEVQDIKPSRENLRPRRTVRCVRNCKLPPKKKAQSVHLINQKFNQFPIWTSTVQYPCNLIVENVRGWGNIYFKITVIYILTCINTNMYKLVLNRNTYSWTLKKEWYKEEKRVKIPNMLGAW